MCVWTGLNQVDVCNNNLKLWKQVYTMVENLLNSLWLPKMTRVYWIFHIGPEKNVYFPGIRARKMKISLQDCYISHYFLCFSQNDKIFLQMKTFPGHQVAMLPNLIPVMYIT